MVVNTVGDSSDTREVAIVMSNYTLVTDAIGVTNVRQCLPGELSSNIIYLDQSNWF